VEDLLIQVLSSFGYPVRRQGSFLEKEPYPDHFFTFWNDSSDGSAFYDNDENAITYTYSVNFYSVDPERTYAILRETKKLLRKNGFEAWGDAYDIASDEQTHTGRGFTVSYYKYDNNLMETNY
jgi:hypothetical protein